MTDNYETLIDQIKDFAKLPYGKSWEDIPAPTCPDCGVGLGRISVSRLPAKTGLRGNPTLKCRDCEKCWAFPAVRGGNPMNLEKGLSIQNIADIEGMVTSHGADNTSLYLKKLGLRERDRAEVRAWLSTSPQLREKIFSRIGIKSVAEISEEFGMNTITITALVRGHLYRMRES
jgi:hypothetical protein